MSLPQDPAGALASDLSPKQFAETHRGELTRLNPRFSYYLSKSSVSEDDIAEYLQEPVESLPPRVLTELPDIELFLVPYLERLAGKESDTSHRVATEKPNNRPSEPSARWQQDDHTVLMLAVHHSGGVAEYHYRLYQMLATLLADQWQPDVKDAYVKALHEELNHRAYGEVDDASWRFKQALLRRSARARLESKPFQEYARHSFEDTMPLYLHGICCDIDVESGPRQLPSRWLRRRLELLRTFYPPPAGYPLFPEEPRKPLGDDARDEKTVGAAE